MRSIVQGVQDFQLAVTQLDLARTAESLAGTRLARATDAWVVQVEKTYGALATELGRAAADRFFPRRTRKSKGPKEDKGGGGSDPVQ